MSIYTIHLIAAARPNFMKVAPAYHALTRQPWAAVKVVHTGQHYDANMSDSFFRDLGMPNPDFHLGVGSGTHAEQTAGVMVGYERVCLEQRPDWIIVVGDVNSTVACALVGAKLCIPVAHLEAGLRSRDRTMPEEINRIVTDALADLLWTPSPDADENLKREGVAVEKIERIGNIMIDSFELLRDKIELDGSRERYALEPRRYGVVTLHRPANVDRREQLALLADQLQRVSAELPLLFAVHPRTRKQLKTFNLLEKLEAARGLQLVAPLGYIEFMNLVQSARVVITDSGGVQEETTYLGIPCLTLRDTTERPITITQGSNRLVRAEALFDEVCAALNGDSRASAQCPEFWDGRTSERLAQSLRRRLDAL
ncbi:MAG: non-hydrolyzing UDP-N-acetylglucosamine 2-epimerase [Gammaproteobacteria bacterium]